MTNSCSGMPGILKSSFEGHTILDLFLPAKANLDYHHRTRLPRAHQLVSQTHKLSVPNLFGPNEASLPGIGHEMGAEAGQEPRLYEGH